MKNNIFLVLKGAAMGIAETIPGVSGGTIAFITGIYERLLNSIKAFSPSLIGVFRNEGLAGVWKKIDGSFLTFLFLGMGLGFGIGLYGIAWFLKNYPPVIWAFFFGLVLASIVYIAGLIKKWDATVVIMFILGTAIAYGITRLPVSEGNESLWFVFVCGAVAVSALMLPGISGSFILLMLGMYQFVLHDTLKEGLIQNHDPHALLIVIVFGSGMILGVTTFSRVLSWALDKYHTPTLAMLAGFMLGAISKVWPWRIPQLVMTEDHQVVEFVKGMHPDKILQEVNTLPAAYQEAMGLSAYLIPTIISLVVGFGLVLYLDRKSKVKL